MLSNSLKIALVDDDQIYQFIMHRTLNKLSADSKLLNFSNCADFFNFLKRNPNQTNYLPDVVLLDLNTPFMNGWEFLAAYKTIKNTLTKTPRIFLITSSVNPSDALKAKEQEDLSGFFNKPVTPEQLLQMSDKSLVKHL